MRHFFPGNHITLLRNGTEYFPALEAAINDAQFEIHIQTFIYEPDATGLRIGIALKSAAQRGVSVNLLLDGYGSRYLPKAYVDDLQAGGVNVMFYRPKISPWTLKRNRLRRLHSKVSVMDGKVAFVGGINIIDDMHVPGHKAPRVDYAVSVQGSIVAKIHHRVDRLWTRIAWMHMQTLRKVQLPEMKVQDLTTTNMRAIFVIRDNVLHRRDIERAYFNAIGHARREILIANAYFIPGRSFRKALIAAAERGVKIRLLLQGEMRPFLGFATHAVYSLFLRHGIEIYEYRKSFMHSKVAVIDDRWATVGSSNIDPFSLLMAYEANVFVIDRKFASTLKDDLERAIHEGGVQVQSNDWIRGHWLKRIMSWIVYGFVRFAVGTIGYPNRH